jgi:hypothetical protein
MPGFRTRKNLKMQSIIRLNKNMLLGYALPISLFEDIRFHDYSIMYSHKSVEERQNPASENREGN